MGWGMKQLTLAAVGFERYAKTTRRAAFLAEMEQVVPWSALRALIEPFYPKPGNGRPPVGVERMLRIYFLQQWFNLSDPADKGPTVRIALPAQASLLSTNGRSSSVRCVAVSSTGCRCRMLAERDPRSRPTGSRNTQISRKLRSLCECCGCLSLRSASASICRIRSRVTENWFPTSSKV